jgi:hypothetical protein
MLLMIVCDAGLRRHSAYAWLAFPLSKKHILFLSLSKKALSRATKI